MLNQVLVRKAAAAGSDAPRPLRFLEGISDKGPCVEALPFPQPFPEPLRSP